MNVEEVPTNAQEEAEGEEVVGQDIPEFPILAPAFSTADREETLFIGEMQLTENSSVKQLRDAARYLRLSSSGSKSKIFNRIRDAYETSLKRRALEVARQDYAKLHPEPRFVDAPVQPSERERKLHEVTHLPFKRWCAFCVMGKSRANLKYASEPAEIANRSNPTVQVDIFFQTAGNCLLLCVDTWSKYVSVYPLRNRISGVIGEKIAEFLATLGHLDTVELAYDNEPVLAAGARMTKLIRSNNGLHTILTAGKFYDKSRTSLAERTIQTVRAQGKTLLSHIEDRAKIAFKETSVLHSWALMHASWLLNRYHVSNSTGVTAYMSVKGRPYRGRVCCFGELVHGLDPLQAKYRSQWRPGAWLGKDGQDHDLVLVGPNEVVRCKAVRKTGEHWDGELLCSASIGPWDLRRGVHTKVEVQPLKHPVPELLSDAPQTDRKSKKDKSPVDPDAEEVLKYAREHPEEDVDIEDHRTAEEGGAPAVEIEPMVETMHEDQVEQSPKRHLEESELPPAHRGRFDHAHQKKKTSEEADVPAKFVRFDPDIPVVEPISKAARTSSSSASGGSQDQEQQVRQIVEEVEIYVEDEPDLEAGEELDAYDWQEQEAFSSDNMLSEEEMKKRGFYDEAKGAPNVSVEELQILDQHAMLNEVARLDDLSVIANLEATDDLEAALKLDTRVVFDWRFREGCWVRRARLVAREFRSGAASTADTFSPTSPLVFVKLLLSLAVTMNLLVSVMDVSDAFLQVVQKDLVIIEVPKWIRGHPTTTRIDTLETHPVFARTAQCSIRVA